MQTETLILAGLLLAVIVLLVFLVRRAGGDGRADALARELDGERQRATAAAVEAGQLRGRLETLAAEMQHERGEYAEQTRALAALNQRIERETTQSAEAGVRLAERETK